MAKRLIDQLKSPQFRPLLLLAGSLIIIIVTIIILVSRKPAPPKDDTSKASAIPKITSVPGGATSEKYQELVQAENERRAKQAQTQGGSAVATIVGTREKSGKEGFGIDDSACPQPGALETNKCAELVAMAQKDKLKAVELLKKTPGFARCLAEKDPALFKKLMIENPDLARQLAKDNPDLFKKLLLSDPEFAKAIESTNPQLLQDLMKNDPDFAKGYNLIKRALQGNADDDRKRRQEDAAKALEEKRLSDTLQKDTQALATAMETQARAALGTWVEVPAQSFTRGEWATKQDKDKNGSDGSGSGGSSGRNSSSSSQDPILKAGEVLYAVLETAVNTDEAGPIMARVVQGPMKGTKLIGTISFVQSPSGGKPERVTLNFNMMNMPSDPTSFTVKAVAIDPDTARTALASDVDHHYLLRYGSMFASSFMQGYAQAITQQGTVQTTASDGGSTTTTAPNLSGSQQIYAALGQVGKSWSSAVSDYFNTPPTVTVDAGTSIGILFLNDVKPS